MSCKSKKKQLLFKATPTPPRLPWVGRQGIPLAHSKWRLVGAWAPRVTSKGVPGLNPVPKQSPTLSYARRVQATGMDSGYYKEKQTTLKSEALFSLKRILQTSLATTKLSLTLKQRNRYINRPPADNCNSTRLLPPESRGLQCPTRGCSFCAVDFAAHLNNQPSHAKETLREISPLPVHMVHIQCHFAPLRVQFDVNCSGLHAILRLWCATQDRA